MDYFIARAGLFANLTGIFAIAGFVALGIFFSGTSIFGPINDVISILQYLSMLPVALALYQKLQSQQSVLSLAALVISVIGVLAFATLQSSLVLGRVTFGQSLPWVLASASVVGLALLLFGVSMFSSTQFPVALAWISIANGISALVGGLAFYRGGWQDPLAIAGLSLYALTTIVWAFWLGRLFA